MLITRINVNGKIMSVDDTYDTSDTSKPMLAAFNKSKRTGNYFEFVFNNEWANYKTVPTDTTKPGSEQDYSKELVITLADENVASADYKVYRIRPEVYYATVRNSDGNIEFGENHYLVSIPKSLNKEDANIAICIHGYAAESVNSVDNIIKKESIYMSATGIYNTSTQSMNASKTSNQHLWQFEVKTAQGNFKLKELNVPAGFINRIVFDDRELWHSTVNYVSFGDSIAAGHTIDENWEKYYGTGSQYGVNGNTSTKLVPGCYTDLIKTALSVAYGHDTVQTTSFARSGDKVSDLMNKLDDETVRNTLRKADYVTVCIGANDVLGPAMQQLSNYLNGDAIELFEGVAKSLEDLRDNSNSSSYYKLLEKLYTINPTALYAFTTVYNPYKYLYIEPSTSAGDYVDGFLGPIMWAIPDSIIKFRGALIESAPIQNLYSRLNGIASITEGFVTELNNIILDKVTEFAKPNFIVADSKAVFDTVPDRGIEKDEQLVRHYNELINVEITRDYTINDLDWGEFWENSLSVFGENNISAAAEALVETVVEKVITPDVDPHPEIPGQHALSCSFMDALKIPISDVESPLKRTTITYHANNTNNETKCIEYVSAYNFPAYITFKKDIFASQSTGVFFDKWSTNSNGSGSTYKADETIYLNTDMDLYAQWTQNVTLTVKHRLGNVTYASTAYTSEDTGAQECYDYYIGGVSQEKLGAFKNGPIVKKLPYGTEVGVVVLANTGTEDNPSIYLTENGVSKGQVGVMAPANDYIYNKAYRNYPITLTADTEIEFVWNDWPDVNSSLRTSYWDCYIRS